MKIESNVKFSDNIWWTRKARIRSEKRLLANALQTQLLLVWYSFCSVAVSIYYLKFAEENDYAGVSWVIFSVLVLCISSFTNGFNFRGRAGLIKECYETLNDLVHKSKKDDANITELSSEYRQVLSICENHTDMDFYFALCEAHLEHPTPLHHKRGLSKHPTCFIWTKVIIHMARRWFFLASFYLLPLILIFTIEIINDCKG